MLCVSGISGHLVHYVADILEDMRIMENFGRLRIVVKVFAELVHKKQKNIMKDA